MKLQNMESKLLKVPPEEVKAYEKGVFDFYSKRKRNMQVFGGQSLLLLRKGEVVESSLSKVLSVVETIVLDSICKDVPALRRGQLDDPLRSLPVQFFYGCENEDDTWNYLFDLYLQTTLSHYYQDGSAFQSSWLKQILNKAAITW